MKKFPKLGLDFVFFFLAFLFVENLFFGDFWAILDWSSAGSMGTAFAQLLFLIGFVMTTRLTLASLKKNREMKKP